MNSKEEILKKIDLAITKACKPPISKSGIRENIYSLILEREQEAREKVIWELVGWMEKKYDNGSVTCKGDEYANCVYKSCIQKAKELMQPINNDKKEKQ